MLLTRCLSDVRPRCRVTNPIPSHPCRPLGIGLKPQSTYQINLDVNSVIDKPRLSGTSKQEYFDLVADFIAFWICCMVTNQDFYISGQNVLIHRSYRPCCGSRTLTAEHLLLTVVRRLWKTQNTYKKIHSYAHTKMFFQCVKMSSSATATEVQTEFDSHPLTRAFLSYRYSEGLWFLMQ